ncbi:MAG: ABC transporter permease [Pseudomonadota bacterium]|nr:ABC transporter permease [Pseudomonadota bacterium]
MPKPVILPTDALFFALLLAVGIFAIYTAGRPHLREPWKRVTRSRVAVICMVVLGFYLLIAVMDSLHFHQRLPGKGPDGGPVYSNEVLSALDWIAGPLRESNEKTYSAPFALTLYVREPIETPGGRQERVYPRLQHGGAHLPADGAGHARDIVATSLAGASLGLTIWAILAVPMLARGACKRGMRFGQFISFIRGARAGVSWRTALWTLATVLVVLAMLGVLSLDYHVLGTDKVGEDVFYQSLKSIRTAVLIGTLTTMVMLPIAVLLGIMAGYFRRWVDDVVQYAYTTLNSIPSVLLIAAAVLMLNVYLSTHADRYDSVAERADLRLLALCLILGLTSWTGLCRLLRGETFKVRELEYIQAATAFGVGHFRIILRHILPNVMHIVLITVVLDFSGLVLAEAVLSYVQIGVDPATHSWGNMINGARLEMAREPVVWWSLAAAMVFMFGLVLSANLFSDAVRDAFDPRLRERPE